MFKRRDYKRTRDVVWMNTNEAASYLRESPEKLVNWRRQGGGPPCEIKSGRLRYRATDVDYFIWMGGCK